MRFLPYERLELRSPLSPQEAAARLQAAVSTKRWSPSPAGAPLEPFRGRIRGRRFAIVPVVQGLNSFLPVVAGEIVADVGGARIRMRIRLQLVPALLAAAWIGWISWQAAAVLRRGHAHGFRDGGAGLAMLAGMAVFGLTLVVREFWSQAREARRMLSELFECVEDAAARG